ncbi:MAG: cytidylyltransferase domain-containing protein [Candidatus Thorarchaeota archaeon]
MHNICFIPARDSSTRLKKKNIAKFQKGNLVTNTIEQAIGSCIFDRIILSSNNDGILDIGRELEIETHLRDDSQDQIIGVVQDSIPNLNVGDNDNLAIVLVTCPLRTSKDIYKAYRIFMDYDRGHPVVSVRKNMNPIQMSFKIDYGGHLEPVFSDEFNRSTRKQDHYDTYYYNDAIIFDTVKNFMKPGRNLFGSFPIPYEMPWERSIAIDYDFQLKMARMLAKEKEDEIQGNNTCDDYTI